jgi:Icc-related predicted phosphoesterase
MKLVVLPDLHEGGIKYLPLLRDALATADWVLLPGDLTIRGSTDAMEKVLAALQEYNPNILAVPGEWDTRHGSHILTQHHCNLHGQFVLLEGMAFIGLGGCLTYQNAPKEHLMYDNFQYEMLLQTITDQLPRRTPLLLMTHHPPHETHADRLYSGKRAGSRAIRDFVDQRQPLLCLTGHLHHVQTIEHIGKTLILNPGPIWLYQTYGYVVIEYGSIVTAEIRPI